ncbi:YafY family protein [Ornithinibacillus sp. FSL M8-0202]|uniref:helix-turn-helix transcriptional regulator n=1 Tax=Ornithinibacillus sp. FSL M8-0202 TaxID=2921616 RepID=UPI0030CE49CF
MPKIDNVLAILWMLSSGGKITAKQISEKLEMNIRTVYRYIDTLSTSGVPIVSEPGHNGGYTLLNNFIQAPLIFNLEEQTSLLHAAVFAEEAGYYGDESLNRAISKLSKYSNQEQQKKLNQHSSILEVINGVSSSTVPYLKELEKAITDGFSVKILYQKSGEDLPNDRLVDPYRIIYWNNKWYVIGFCHLRNDIRSFKIERVGNLVITEHEFNQPNQFLARDYFMKNLLPTLNEGKELISVVIKGNTNSLDYICQNWFLGHYLQERISNQAVFALEKDTIHTYLPNILIPYGKSIQVIEPISLKDRLIEVLSDLIKFHQV